MFDVKNVVGMKVEEAVSKLSQAGFKVEVLNPEIPQRLTCEYRRDRVQVEVQNEIVTFASIG